MRCPNVLRLLDGVRQLVVQGLREEASRDAGSRGKHSHDQDGSWAPVGLQQFQQHGGDPPKLGCQGTDSYTLVPKKLNQGL